MSRICYLSPPDLHRLDWACRPIRDAFGSPPYLVGSAMASTDKPPRDIDLRLILDDRRAKRLGVGGPLGLLLNVALSDFISRAAGLPWPIDFQIQSMTEANGAEHGGKMRNPMGIR